MTKLTLLFAFLAFAGTVTLVHPPVAHGCGFDPRALNACASAENQEIAICEYLYITGFIDAPEYGDCKIAAVQDYFDCILHIPCLDTAQEVSHENRFMLARRMPAFDKRTGQV